MLGRRDRQTRPTLEQAKSAIERACGALNPILAVVAVGLAILNISCYAALEIGRRHALSSDADGPALRPLMLTRSSDIGPP